MWLYFNENGQLIETLEHGNVARSGTTNFEIFAFFNNVDVPNLFSNATIKLRKPDLSGSEYPLLLMKLETKRFVKVSESEETNYFEVDKEYTGYYFNFADFNDSQDSEVLLDTPGMWQAVITLIGSDRRLNVQGVVNFYVENGVFDEKGHEISIDSLLNPIYTELSQKMDKNVSNIDMQQIGATTLSLNNMGDIPLNIKYNNDSSDAISVYDYVTNKATYISRDSNATTVNYITLPTTDGKLLTDTDYRNFKKSKGFVKLEHTSLENSGIKLVGTNSVQLLFTSGKRDKYKGNYIKPWGTKYKNEHMSITLTADTTYKQLASMIITTNESSIEYLQLNDENSWNGKSIFELFSNIDVSPTLSSIYGCKIDHIMFFDDILMPKKCRGYINRKIGITSFVHPIHIRFMIKFVNEYNEKQIAISNGKPITKWEGNMANVWLECQMSITKNNTDDFYILALRFIPRRF